MYFTRETETALIVVAACARRPGRSLAFWEIAEPGNGSMEEIARSASLLLRHGLLKGDLDGRVTLAIDPANVTLGAILRLTQPDLTRPGHRSVRRMGKNVFTLAVEAASSNFLRIAEQFTVADFMADRPSGERYAACGSYCKAHGERPSPQGNIKSE